MISEQQFVFPENQNAQAARLVQFLVHLIEITLNCDMHAPKSASTLMQCLSIDIVLHHLLIGDRKNGWRNIWRGSSRKNFLGPNNRLQQVYNLWRMCWVLPCGCLKIWRKKRKKNNCSEPKQVHSFLQRLWTHLSWRRNIASFRR